MKKFYKILYVLMILCGALVLLSCGGNKLIGRWETTSTNHVAYEFTKSEYVMEVSIVFTVAKIKGSYRLSGDSLFTTAKKISFDDGKTWSENDGMIFSKDEQSVPIAFNSDGTISISNVKYRNLKVSPKN